MGVHIRRRAVQPLVKKRSKIRMNYVLQAQNSRMSESEKSFRFFSANTFGS